VPSAQGKPARAPASGAVAPRPNHVSSSEVGWSYTSYAFHIIPRLRHVPPCPSSLTRTVAHAQTCANTHAHVHSRTPTERGELRPSDGAWRASAGVLPVCQRHAPCQQHSVRARCVCVIQGSRLASAQILSPTDTLRHMHTEHGELQSVMVAGLQGWCCVSVQRGISGYRRQHSGAWHVSHPMITPVVCTNT